MQMIKAVVIIMVVALGVAACDHRSPDSRRNTLPAPSLLTDANAPRSRYAFNNQCFVFQANGNDQYVVANGDGSYSATAVEIGAAEAFYLKPLALGKYLLYNRSGQLMSANGGATTTVALSAATADSEWTVTGFGDTTVYPDTPQENFEPTAAGLATYRDFNDPNTTYLNFTLVAGNALTLNADQSLSLTPAAAGNVQQSFRIQAIEQAACAVFPEAQSNVTGTTFSGTTSDGRVLGMTDAHVHISATNFLGKAQWGSPFHRYGVTHAMSNCEEYHGPGGSRSVVEAAFAQDFDGHNTTGWPTFPEWPARNNLFHEAIYWKWLERAWMGGLRVIVTDLVDNETLCEQSRNAAAEPTLDCNSMNNAGRQAGTMYAMQDYIDAQNGGRGEGWYQIVHDPIEARAVIEQGKIAVVLGIEISNLMDCKVNYNPLRMQEPFEETGTGVNENKYTCTMTETGAPNEILTQLQRIHDWGVRQVVTIHEFDNAFGGNGIFDGLVLNVGNREDSGGVPGGALSSPASFLTSLSSGTDAVENPTGEFWTTYLCPEENDDANNPFSGYIFGDAGGTVLESARPCPYTGQGGRPGGTTPCYPTTRQCNARWLTPIGLYFYSKLMEFGMIFDIDHLEMEMKTQGLELAEAQDPPYPFVSTHGTFGGTSVDQATRMINNGGFIYPSIGSTAGYLDKMAEMRGIWQDAGEPFIFGFGFGTDTNGLSAQSPPRSEDRVAARPITYPFTLFQGGVFNQLPDFDNIAGVTFEQPDVRDPEGNGRNWHVDEHGNAHYGMLADQVQEIQLEGTVQDMRDLFNGAELYLQMWERTVASQQGILSKTQNDNADADTLGNVVLPDNPILRPAPVPSDPGATP